MNQTSITRVLRRTVVTGVAVGATMFAAQGSAHAQYPPAPPPPPTPGAPSLELTSFGPVCAQDTPYIQYSIVPVGFETTGPAVLTFRDVNGKVVQTNSVSALSGRVIYPGATVGPNGEGTDWPGWKFEQSTGTWVVDETDAVLRQGLSVTVEINPTATTTVSYPPATSACAGPVRSAAPVPGAGSAPGTPSGSLPRTGGPESTQVLLVAGSAVAAGLAITGLTARSRRRATAAAS